MSLIKSASTALSRHMRDMATEKLIPFAKEIEQHVKDGRLAKRTFQIKTLGEGATQKADLVMHPTFGLAARKVTHGATLHPDDLARRNQFLRRVSQDDVKSFAKLKGFEHEGYPLRQRTYMEYVPGEHPKSKAGPETWKEISRGIPDLDARLRAGDLRWEDIRRLHYIGKHRLNPELNTQLKGDLRKVRRFGFGHDVNDVAVNNIVDNKIVDADTRQIHMHEDPDMFKREIYGPKKGRARRMKDIFGEKHPFDTKIDEVKPFDPSEKVSKFGPQAPMVAGVGALTVAGTGLLVKDHLDHKRKSMSLVKSATIQGGAYSNLPNAWKQKKGMGAHANVPLVMGLDSSLPDMPKLAARGDMALLNRLRQLDDGSFDKDITQIRADRFNRIKDKASVLDRNYSYQEAHTINVLDKKLSSHQADRTKIALKNKIRGLVGKEPLQVPPSIVEELLARPTDSQADAYHANLNRPVKRVRLDTPKLDTPKLDTPKLDTLKLDTGIPIEHAPSNNLGSALRSKLSTRAKIGIGAGAALALGGAAYATHKLLRAKHNNE